MKPRAGIFESLSLVFRGDVETILPFAPFILGLGLLIAIGLRVGWAPFPCAMLGLIGLGSAGCCLGNWRTERGLWMLAGLFWLIYGGIHGLFVVYEVFDAIQGRAMPPFFEFADLGSGAMLLGIVTSFLWRVMIANYRLSQLCDTPPND